MGEKTSVSTSGQFYIVTDATGRQFTVQKDKTCSCGKKNCWHVAQVKKYLKNGGQRAEERAEIVVNPAIFMGNSLLYEPLPQKPPQTPPPSYWQERAMKLRALQVRMKHEGAKNGLEPIAQYWHDLASLSKSQMCDKWRLPVQVVDTIEQLRLQI